MLRHAFLASVAPGSRSRLIRAAGFLSLAVVLSGCAAIDGAQSAIGLYDSAKSVTSGYHAYTSVKDLKNASPTFAGYDGVVVLADIRPRENADNLAAIFASNLAGYTTAVAKAVRAPLQVCSSLTSCSGKVLVLNFREDAYDRNLVQRLTVGDKIRGRLVFTDAASGRILDEKQAEMSENYASLARLTSGFVMGAMYKSFPPATDAEGERIGKALQQIPVVAPEYERVLGKAG